MRASFAVILAAVGIVAILVGYFRYPSNEELMDKIRNHETEAAQELRDANAADTTIRERLYLTGVLALCAAMLVYVL